MSQENPPSDHTDALRRWKSAKRDFKAAEKRAAEVLSTAARAADLPDLIAEAGTRFEAVRIKCLQLGHRIADQEIVLGKHQQNYKRSQDEVGTAKHALHQVLSGRPSFWAQILRTRRFKHWMQQKTRAVDGVQTAEVADSIARTENATSTSVFADMMRSRNFAAAEMESIRPIQESLQGELDELRIALGGSFIDDTFFIDSHEKRHLAAPWLNKAMSKARDDAFEAAVRLHKAFVDCAAKPLRHNLGLLMDSFGTRSFGTPEKDAVVPHLWSSLFLLVPVVSTTFASVARMFSGVGANSFGWLMIDEAGQALPQAAVGALMRCNRAVVVGDPIQIEPVVVLPEQLTEAVCKEFNIDETRFNAPAASAQTLADTATSHFASFETKMGSRNVGVPLLVHRRCAEPMFSISNAIAYENMMVQAKLPKASKIMDVLGTSRWMSVNGGGQDKWCPEEGEVVIDLLRSLKAAGVDPNIYIVTPFVVVQDRLRERIRTSRLLDGWVDNAAKWPYERLGTVHTVQGREAEAVIFVLGAPLASQNGARNWAGGRPNLLNVAVSRAQEALYVVGNRDLWCRAGVFSELSARL